jgi:hypothetical protein
MLAAAANEVPSFEADETLPIYRVVKKEKNKSNVRAGREMFILFRESNLISRICATTSLLCA